MNLAPSKLPDVGTTIFTVMSALAAEHNAVNLSQGFPNYECSAKLRQLVSDYMQKGFNQYAPMAGVPILRERIAEKIAFMYHAQVHPDDITITAGGTQALFTAVTAFVHPGDEVIVIEPAYDSYRPSIELCGGIPVVYELSAPDYRIDWAAFAALISPRTRMIMINTPHNPTATVWTAQDIHSLATLVRNTGIIILSDEVYEHLIFDGVRHESVLRYSELWERSMVVYSFGKTCHVTGWKMGYVVAPEPLTREFRKVHQFNVFSVNTPVQYAIAEFLSDREEYLSLPNFFERKRDYFLDCIRSAPFRALSSKGTYFQLLDYSEFSTENDFDFAKRLTKEFGIASIPVSAFYSSKRDDKIIRLCFAKTEETLEQAGKCLSAVC